LRIELPMENLGPLLLSLRRASNLRPKWGKEDCGFYRSNKSNCQTCHIYPMLVDKTLYHVPLFVIFCCLLIILWFCHTAF